MTRKTAPITEEHRKLHNILFYHDVNFIEEFQSHYGSIDYTHRIFSHINFCPECGADVWYYRYNIGEAREEGLI